MFQRLKNKKGFTLIELIVVIAILGILALIAIPRFAGFTDRAKKSNDVQYGSLVGNSAMVLLAASDIRLTSNVDPAATPRVYASITIGPDGAIATVTNILPKTGATAITAGALSTLITPLQPVKVPQFYNKTGDTITIRLSGDGVFDVVGAP